MKDLVAHFEYGHSVYAHFARGEAKYEVVRPKRYSIGRSRCGCMTQRHACVDVLGNLIRLILGSKTKGQREVRHYIGGGHANWRSGHYFVLDQSHDIT